MPKKLILSGEERDYEIEIEELTWQRTIIVAAAYGWRPEGPKQTSLSDYAKSSSSINAEDAQALSVALEKSLTDIPDQRREGINEEDLPPLEYFGGWMRDVLEEIIELCRRGEFVVERR